MKQPSFSEHKRLGQRIALANMLTAGAALLVASLVLLFYQFFSMKSSLIEDVRVQARIVGDNSAAAILFKDKRAGEETLAALESSPVVQAAALFDRSRVPFAGYVRGGAKPVPVPSDRLLANGFRFEWDELEVAQAIKVEGAPAGFVVIRAGLSQMYLRLIGYALLMLAVVLVSLAAAYLLLAHMRREVRSAEAHLDYLAHFDSVTNLPNRHAFNRRLAFALSSVDQFGGSVALLLLDLDNFKVVNDTLGHQAGDRLLQQVARRLVDGLRRGDVVCRIGGDEFAIIGESHSDGDDIDSVAAKVLGAFSAPFELEIHELHVSASIGISLYPQDARDLQTLTRNADTAMYHAKNRGKNAFERFDAEMDQRAQNRLSLEMNLRKAIERKELFLEYQPQVDLHTGRLAGFEALLRWRRPDGEMVGPSEFIRVAEESGLIVPIGRWVLNGACRQAAQWRDEGLGDYVISVNLSAHQTKDKALIGDILAALHGAGLPARQLELEITETVLMENVHANVSLLHRLQTEGIRLSIDDFGTGYSSMAYLKRFPIDQVKIDRTFVRDIPGDGDDEAIATAIIAMAHSLGLSVVAEGVETEQQLQFLLAAKCDLMQGYYFARPMPAEQVALFLQEYLRAYPGCK